MTAGYRNLVARVILQALNDGRLTSFPSRDWPWTDLEPALELAAFWYSPWCEALCDWLDLDADQVRQVAEYKTTGGDS